MYIAPSSGHISLNLNMPFKWIGGLRSFSDVWSENAALFERLMEIHSNPPKLYYGFKGIRSHLQIFLNITKLCRDERYTIMMM